MRDYEERRHIKSGENSMDVRLNDYHIKEICRYSGFGTSTPGDKDLQAIHEAMDIVNAEARPLYVYREFEDCAFFSGKDIRRHLEGCHTIILLAATLGAGVDAAIRKASYRDVSLQLYIDACASTLIEELCDTVEADLRMKAAEGGEYLTGRFSPGYGDLPIECQRDFVNSLDAVRRIGLSVSGSGVLIPSKSVTAVMGMSAVPQKGVSGGCGSCGIRDTCYLRRRGTPCRVNVGYM